MRVAVIHNCIFPALLLLAACSQKIDPTSSPAHSNTRIVPALQGRVLDNTSAPLRAVRVEAAGAVTHTDSEGYWALPVPEEQSTGTAINFFRSDYAPYSYRYPIEITASAFVQVSLMPVQIMQTVSVADGAVITSTLGEESMQLAIVLPPHFMDVDGDTVDVAVAIVRPDKGPELKRFPGDYIGVDAGSGPGRDLLRTFGTVSVQFSQNGVPLDDVRLKAPALMQMRLDATSATEFAVGATIATWWLDADTAEWMREGAATVVEINGIKYAEWRVNHFTWWNVDYPLESHGCLAVEFSNTATIPAQVLAHSQVLLDGYDYYGRSTPQPIRPEALTVLTGWRGHEVRLSVQYPGAPQSPLILPITPRNDSEGNVENGTFRLPDTSGSGMWNQGPDGEVLDPRRHCRLITRDYALKQGVIEGYVYGPDGKGVGDVTVYIPEIAATTRTNPDGHYTFAHVPWSRDLDLMLTVTGQATNAYTINTETVARTVAHQRVNLQLRARDIAPRFTRMQLSTTEAGLGSTVDFEVTAVDNAASQIWTIGAGLGTVEIDTPIEHSAEKGLIYSSTVRGRWFGPSAGGTVTLYMRVTDSTGHSAHLSRSVTWINHSPVLQLEGPASSATTVAVTYLAHASDPDGQPLSYSWYVNGQRQAETTAQIALNYSVEGVYRVRVEVRDGEHTVTREILTVASYAQVTHTDDTTAPQTQLLAGPEGPTSATGASVSFASPDADTDHFECYLNAPPYTVCSNPWVLSGLSDGAYTAVIRAVDGSGNVDPSPVVADWIVDLTPPATTILATPVTTASTAEIEFVASDLNGISGYLCSLDDAPAQPCTSPVSYPGLTSGPHSFRVTAIDNAGNADPYPPSIAWTILPPRWSTLALGEKHTCGIREGRLYCWGDNAYGQLGLDPAVVPATARPTRVGTATNWTAVSAGADGTCGISDARLYCWGVLFGYTPLEVPANEPNLQWQSLDNIGGHCGIASGKLLCLVQTEEFPYDYFMQRIGVSITWSKFVIGYGFGCGIDNGFMYCWYGQLGEGEPVQIGPESGWTDVSQGCGIHNGELLCWSMNNLTPQQLGTFNDWTSVSSGSSHICASRSSLSYCWGYDTEGQLGDGEPRSHTATTLPTQPIPGVSAVIAGYNRTCGSIALDWFCWGPGLNGELGFGTVGTWYYDAWAPQDITGHNNWSHIAVGLDIMSGYGKTSCGIDNGSLYCWGSDFRGTLGNGADTSDRYTPSRVGSSTGWTDISTDGGHTCGIDDGKLFCWGLSKYTAYDHLLGFPTTTMTVDIPTQVGSSNLWTQVSAGPIHTCGINAGSLYCWGAADAGLGLGPDVYSTDPPVQVGDRTDWTFVDAGSSGSTCGIAAGKLYCWGYNGNGEVGNGDLTPQYLPIQIGTSATWTHVSLGSHATCGINGEVLYCWGSDEYHQLGDGPDNISALAPKAVSSETGWTSVSVAYAHACGVRADDLYCWGRDSFFTPGLLGHGTRLSSWMDMHRSFDSPYPYAVDTLGTWTTVSASPEHVCGIHDGIAACWGSDEYGALGNGTSAEPTQPISEPVE